MSGIKPQKVYPGQEGFFFCLQHDAGFLQSVGKTSGGFLKKLMSREVKSQ